MHGTPAFAGLKSEKKASVLAFVLLWTSQHEDPESFI